MDITHATIEDVDVLCDLLSLLFEQEAEFHIDTEAQRRGLIQIISNSAVGSVLIAREGAQIIAMATLLFTVSTALGETVALLEDVIVLPKFQNQGVGSALVTCAIQFTHSKQCKHMTLLTDSDNFNAQRFYQKQGFRFSNMLPMRILL
jgi:ribosomal protein S18 acetylase RimI-like enzyme